MTTHSKGKVFEDDPDFDKALEELRVAWKGGNLASDEARGTVRDYLLSVGHIKDAAEAVMALKTTNSGTNPAAEQKYNLLLAAGPSIMTHAEHLMRELNSLVMEPAMALSSWKSKMATHRATIDYLKPFNGYYEDAELGEPISAACALGELARSCEKPPSAQFTTAFRAKSRISKFLAAAEGKLATEHWAQEYLLSSIYLNGSISKSKQADAIVNTLEASASLKVGHGFRSTFLDALKDNLVDSENTLTELGRLVSKKVRASSNVGHDEFKAILQPPKQEEDAVELERTLLLEPTSWVARLQSEEPVDYESIDISFFKEQPSHILLNSALVIANAEVSEKNNVTRNILACLVLRSIGEEFLVMEGEGKKSLSVPKTQEDLLERIKQIANQPEVRKNVEEYCRVRMEDGNNTTVAERLLSLYDKEAEEAEEAERPKLPFTQEVVERFKKGEITNPDVLEYVHLDDSSRMKYAAALIGIPLATYQTEATESRKKMLSDLLEGVDQVFIGEATNGEVAKISLEMVEDLESLEKLVMTMRLHEASTKLVQMDWMARATFEEYGAEALPFLVQAVSDIIATHEEEEVFQPLSDYMLHSIYNSIPYARNEEARKEALQNILELAEGAGYTRLAAELKEALGIEEPEELDTGDSPEIAVTGEAELNEGEAASVEEELESGQEAEEVLGEGPVEEPEEEPADELILPKPTEPEPFNREPEEPSIIFEKLEEAEPLIATIASDELETLPRAQATEQLIELLEAEGNSPQKLIVELLSLSRTGELGTSINAAAAMLSLPHVSKYNWNARRNSSLLVSALVDIPDHSLKPAIEQKLTYGTETEADYTLDVLAERRRRSYYLHDHKSATTLPQELALEQLNAITRTESTRFARVLLSLSEMGVSQDTLMRHLNEAREKDQESVDAVVLGALNSYRSQMPGALFPDYSAEGFTESEAAIAEEFLHFLEGGDESTRELSIAAAVSNMETADAARFAVQNFSDSAGELEKAWRIVLSEFKETHADEVLMSAFHELSLEKQAIAISILENRLRSMDKAEFLLSICDSKDENIAAISADALADMDFAGLDAVREFNVLYAMRTHSNAQLVDTAEDSLQFFLADADEIPSAETVDALSSLYLDDPNPAINELARRVLLSNPVELLMEKGLSEGVPDTLEIYALAKNMQEDIDGLEQSVQEVLEQDTSEEDLLEKMQFMVAATASGNKKYAEKILVNYLGDEDVLSDAASQFLLRLGSMGVEIAGDAASRTNHPEGISIEITKRISDKALETLCSAKAFERVVPLLSFADPAIRANVYNLLEKSPESEEKTAALISALSSTSENLRLAALNLIPCKSEHRDYVLLLVDDSSEEVSGRAAEFVAPLFYTEELVEFLNSNSSESAKQKVADAYLEKFPGAIDELASRLEEDMESVLNALKFFQDPTTLTYLFAFHKDADEEGRALLAEPLQYFCRSLSENPSEQNMLLLLIAHNCFDYEGVREEAQNVSRSPDAELMLNAVLKSGNPELLFSTTELFLTAENEDYAVKTATKLRELGGVPPEQLAKPYQQVLFGKKEDTETNMGRIDSPVHDTDADPMPYRLVKRVAIEQMVEGNGAPASSKLFFLFADTFNDIEGYFNSGLTAVSELVWASRKEVEGERAYLARKVPTLVANDLEEDTKLLASILLTRKYGQLAALRSLGINKDSNELTAIVTEHALRNFVEVAYTYPHNLMPPEANSKLELLAELQARQMIDSSAIDALVPTKKESLEALEGTKINRVHPIVLALIGKPLLTKEELANAKDALKIASKLREEKARRALLEFAEMKGQARSDGAKMERRAAPPVRDKPAPPIKIERASEPPKK